MTLRPIVPAYLSVADGLSLSAKPPNHPFVELSMLGVTADGHELATDKHGFVYTLKLGSRAEVFSVGQSIFTKKGDDHKLQFVAVAVKQEDDKLSFKLKDRNGAERIAGPDLHPLSVDLLSIAAKCGAEDAVVETKYLCQVENRLALNANRRIDLDMTPVDLTDVVINAVNGVRHFVRILANGTVFVAEVKYERSGNYIGRVMTLSRVGDVMASHWQKLHHSVTTAAATVRTA